MKKVLFLFTLLFAVLLCAAQRRDTLDLSIPPEEHRDLPNNSVFIELLGNAMLIGSLNDERVFFHEQRFYITSRMGIGYKPGQYKTISIPILVNGIYQVSNVFAVECGLGANISYTHWPSWSEEIWAIMWSYVVYHDGGDMIDPLLTGNIGIRLQAGRGFLFRFGFTPVLNIKYINADLVEYSILPKKIAYWFGVSLGYSFK